ncbi:MAG: PsbP-related protein [Patescibacteria group bacterium]
MDNQTATPNPTPTPENIPVQNPAVQETSPSQVYTAPQPVTPPPPPKSFLSNKIILLIVILLILLGLGGTYLALNSKPQSKPTSGITPTPLPTEVSAKAGTSIDETANWKTYTNTKYDYSIKYPQSWNIQSPGGGQFGDECKSADGNSEIIELASKDHKSCGFLGDYVPSDHVEIIIRASSTPYSEIPGLEKITVAGQTATKYKFTKDSEGPAPTATIISFGRNNTSYSIYIQQPRIGVDYDPFLDQILSTFQFTN